jgi:acyl dehydratase
MSSQHQEDASAITRAFDPAQHRRHETRWFDDFALGEKFLLPSRTMTEALFLAFQAASGDNHPVHYDVEYCRRRGMPHMLAHGYQVLIQTAAGAGEFPFLVEDSLIGFLEQSSQFRLPVYVGDTLYPTLEIAELAPNRKTGVVGLTSTVHNQAGELVMTGAQRYLIRKRPAQAGESDSHSLGGEA